MCCLHKHFGHWYFQKLYLLTVFRWVTQKLYLLTVFRWMTHVANCQICRQLIADCISAIVRKYPRAEREYFTTYIQKFCGNLQEFSGCFKKCRRNFRKLRGNFGEVLLKC